MVPSNVPKGLEREREKKIRMRFDLDGTFHAIATILHRVPRDVGDARGKRTAGSPRQGDRDPIPVDFTDGWIRVAL